MCHIICHIIICYDILYDTEVLDRRLKNVHYIFRPDFKEGVIVREPPGNEFNTNVFAYSNSKKQCDHKHLRGREK